MTVFHTIYGLRVATSLAFPSVPAQPDLGLADVRVRMKEFPVDSSILPPAFYTSPRYNTNGEPNLRLAVLEDGAYFGFFYSDGARFAIERQGHDVWADWPEDYSLEDACTYLVGPILGFVLRLQGITCFHSSAIVVDGRAVALLGFHGAGKSTTAAACACLGFSILSDDLVALAEQGGRFMARPGYPRLNLWPPSVEMLFGSEGALPCITPTWAKRYIALNQNSYRFEPEPVPLGALYILDGREPDLASPVLEDVATGDALPLLVAHTYGNYFLDRTMQRQDFGTLGRLVTTLPIRRVRGTTDPEKIFSLCDLITTDAKRLMGAIPVAAGDA